MKDQINKIRWGIAGLGNVVTGRFAPALSRSTRSVLSACSTRDIEAARPFAGKHSVSRVHGSFDQLVSDPDVDVIYIATPNSLHYPQARQALLAGKHVLCEKPLALSVVQGNELVAVAGATNKMLKVAYQFRFEELFGRVRDHIRVGGLGDLRSVRMFGAAAGAVRAAGWRENPDEGGILSDLAVHFLDLLPWMTGLDFTDISARANPPDITISSMQTVNIMGTLGCNCHGLIGASREMSHGQNSLSVEGTNGSIVVPAWRGVQQCELTVIDAAGRRTETIAPSSIFEREIGAFEEEIDGKATALATAADGIRTIVLASAIRQSIQSGQVVAVE